MTTYSEKLKDPRWQKKRLEVLERDEWACKRCKSKDKTLHVHHDFYDDEPWNTPNQFLQTMCDKCHKREHKWSDFYKKLGEDKTDALISLFSEVGFDVVVEYVKMIVDETKADTHG